MVGGVGLDRGVRRPVAAGGGKGGRGQGKGHFKRRRSRLVFCLKVSRGSRRGGQAWSWHDCAILVAGEMRCVSELVACSDKDPKERN